MIKNQQVKSESHEENSTQNKNITFIYEEKRQVKSEIYKEENLTTENNNISFIYEKKNQQVKSESHEEASLKKIPK
jgi:hypothetical protein